MRTASFLFQTLFTVLIFSCTNQSSDSTTDESKTNPAENGALEVTGIEIPDIDTLALIQNLQGVWREPEYPFNRVEFKNTTVRMVEEGVAEPSVFRPFSLSHLCPYDVNNMEKSQLTDTILVIEDADRCEKLSFSRDSLILSGYNPHSQSIYRIDYVRVQ